MHCLTQPKTGLQRSQNQNIVWENGILKRTANARGKGGLLEGPREVLTFSVNFQAVETLGLRIKIFSGSTKTGWIFARLTRLC